MGHKTQPSKVRQQTPPEGVTDRVDDKPPVNLVEPSRCRVCGSTERSPYSNVRRLDHAGLTPDGRPYKQVVWRRTTCLKCGQARDDKTFE